MWCSVHPTGLTPSLDDTLSASVTSRATPPRSDRGRDPMLQQPCTQVPTSQVSRAGFCASVRPGSECAVAGARR